MLLGAELRSYSQGTVPPTVLVTRGTEKAGPQNRILAKFTTEYMNHNISTTSIHKRKVAEGLNKYIN